MTKLNVVLADLEAIQPLLEHARAVVETQILSQRYRAIPGQLYWSTRAFMPYTVHRGIGLKDGTIYSLAFGPVRVAPFEPTYWEAFE